MLQIKTSDDIVHKPINCRPHVVLLGAGASRAAFPNGDKHRKKLPVMNDLVDVVEIYQFLNENNISYMKGNRPTKALI